MGNDGSCLKLTLSDPSCENEEIIIYGGVRKQSTNKHLLISYYVLDTGDTNAK